MRLKDADALILAIATAGQNNKGGRYVVGDIWELNFQEIREVISNVPTVDAVPVVRCKDCKHSEHIKNAKGEDCAVCWNNKAPVFHEWCVPIDWFCADGEKRDE